MKLSCLSCELHCLRVAIFTVPMPSVHAESGMHAVSLDACWCLHPELHVCHACRAPVLCAVRALGIYWVQRFHPALHDDDFPDPTRGGDWNKTACWPANKPHSNVSYAQQAKALKAHFKAADIISKKITHSGRVASACTMDELGAPQSVRALSCM